MARVSPDRFAASIYPARRRIAIAIGSDAPDRRGLEPAAGACHNAPGNGRVMTKTI